MTPGQECFKDMLSDFPEDPPCTRWEKLTSERQDWWERLAEWRWGHNSLENRTDPKEKIDTQTSNARLRNEVLHHNRG